MELDRYGNRFEHFRPDLPYELAAGAHMYESDGPKYRFRVQKAFQCFSGKPFYELGSLLKDTMENHLVTLEGWDSHYLKLHGDRIQLKETLI